MKKIKQTRRQYSLAALAVAVVAFSSIMYVGWQLSYALPQPSFRVACEATRMAADDAIVYPGQPGKAHMHTFYGNRTPDAFSTTASLLAASPKSDCQRNYSTVDQSGYWVPTLYKDNVPIFSTAWGEVELSVYYKKAGDAGGTPVAQGFPQGLRMIAGDMNATTPQDNVWFKCMNTIDTGSQNSYGHAFPSCTSAESLIAEVNFPDCWNGTTLDSTNHKTHMAFSTGNTGVCPATHPVKLPKITYEAKYTNVNGPASSFKFSSGGAYSFHGDFWAAWEPRAMAGLVNECLNFVTTPMDCNIYNFDAINISSATQAQIDKQYFPDPTAPAPPAPTPIPTGLVTINDTVLGRDRYQFNYGGAWFTDTSSAQTAYQANNHYVSQTGAVYEVKFSGTQIKAYGEKSAGMGIAAYSIDGGAETLVDQYSSTKAAQVLHYTSPTLASGTHTLKVRNTGTKNAASNGTWLVADKVDIMSSPVGSVTPTPSPTPSPTPAPSPTPTPSPAPGNGDTNGDGRVNALDLSILISHDGQNYPSADFNKDGTVGAADMAILLSKWTW